MSKEIIYKGSISLHISKIEESYFGDNLKLKNMHEAIAHTFAMDHENDVTRVYKDMTIHIKQNLPHHKVEVSFTGTLFLNKTDINDSALGSGFKMPYAHRAIGAMLSSNSGVDHTRTFNNVEITVSQN